jgi:hypothetical protein
VNDDDDDVARIGKDPDRLEAFYFVQPARETVGVSEPVGCGLKWESFLRRWRHALLARVGRTVRATSSS